MIMHQQVLVTIAGASPAPLHTLGRQGVSVLEIMLAGGTIGFIIILLSVVAMALVVMHMLQIRESTLAPGESVDALHEFLARGDTEGAVRYCEDDDNNSFLTRVIGAGLLRCRRSPFGALELKGALEEAGQEQVARLYRSTDGLGLIAAIAPMLGLLGTVVGMVGAFDTLSAAEGFARPDQLAGDISKALVTTLMGLTLAIPCMAAFTYFRNRIDSLASSIAQQVDEMAAHLEGADVHNASTSARPAAPGRGPGA
ncbi:MAG: MotA/TolQ/ExbB proton channel family protein [Phycisphaeraceae bacterium]|nr:MAG: MotA/TolQ/ExbB proton channel family protein [Phycisphaeraceae bacterium]